MIGAMTEAEIAALASWLAGVGLKGSAETALVEGFCEQAVAAGLPLARVVVFIDTLHPIHEGHAFRWEREKPVATVTEYGRSIAVDPTTGDALITGLSSSPDIPTVNPLQAYNAGLNDAFVARISF